MIAGQIVGNQSNTNTRNTEHVDKEKSEKCQFFLRIHSPPRLGYAWTRTLLLSFIKYTIAHFLFIIIILFFFFSCGIISFVANFSKFINPLYIIKEFALILADYTLDNHVKSINYQ